MLIAIACRPQLSFALFVAIFVRVTKWGTRPSGQSFLTSKPYETEIPYETAGKLLQQFWSKCRPELLFQPPYQCVVRTDTRSPADFRFIIASTACRFAPTAHGQTGTPVLHQLMVVPSGCVNLEVDR
jgi:hypothetical protein